MKFYIIFSLIVFVLMLLQNMSLVNRANNKYKDRLEKHKTKKNIAGSILGWLKILIMSFIPIYNLVMLIVILFCGNKVIDMADKAVEDALKKEEVNNKNSATE